MAALREVVAEFSIKLTGQQGLKQLDKNLESTKKHLKESEEGLAGFGGKLKELGVLFVEAFAAKEVAEFFKTQAELGEQLEHTALKTGLSIEQLQKLQYAANMSGVSAEQLTGAIGKLSLQLGGGIAGKGGPAVEALAKMGIKAKDTAGKTRDMTDILGDAADKIAQMPDSTKRTAAAVQLFGRSGKELLPLLLKGKDGIHELSEEAQKMGFVLGQDFTEAARKAAEEEKKLEWASRSLKAGVAQALFPAFTSITQKATGWLQSLTHLSKETTAVSSGTTLLSLAMGFKLFNSMGKLAGISRGGFLGNTMGLAKTGLYAAGIVGVALAFDDLFALFKGKKSLVGEVMDKIGGKGTSAEFVKDLTNAWNEMAEAITGVKGESSDLADVWQQFKSALETMLVWGMHALGKFSKVVAAAFTLVLGGPKDVGANFKHYNKALQEMGDAVFAQDKDYGVDIGHKGVKVSKKAQKEYGLDANGNKLRKQTGESFYDRKSGQMVNVTQHITVKHVEESKDAALKAVQRTKQDTQNALNAVRNRAPDQFLPDLSGH